MHTGIGSRRRRRRNPVALGKFGVPRTPLAKVDVTIEGDDDAGGIVMARIDAYVRSLERFGARGMVMQSNQNVVLKFADGDRPAAQSVPHDQLISMVREVAPRV